MHNSYFVLRELGNRLNDLLVGYRVHSCYSQDKDELVIQFNCDSQHFFVHAILQNNFSMIRVPDNLKRARKNSVDLFPELFEARVNKVYCVENERCLCIEFDQNHSLLIKMFGNQSNVLLCRNGVSYRIFRNNLKDDLNFSISRLNRTVTLNQNALRDHDWDFTKVWPALGGMIKKHIESIGYAQLNESQKWETLQKVLQKLENPEFFLYHQKATPALTLFEPPEWYFHSSDVIEALNNFFSDYTRTRSIQLLKKKALLSLEKEKKKALGVISKSRQRLAQLDRNISYREIADIIMANLYSIPPMVSEIQLPDFQTGAPVSIKLKPSLSPQKNAENYYRKSKNQGKEIKVLTENLSGSQSKLAEVNDHIAFVRECTELKLLKDYCKNHRLLKAGSGPERQSPFKELSFRGFTILIGRNAANNDLLTQKYSHKDDLWLHAKDVRGSHVVIRQVPGRPFPSDVIEKAAQVAAFYSKRKHDSLCPVIYTPRKYVRKPKGAAPGEVVVEREKVILVKPDAGFTLPQQF